MDKTDKDFQDFLLGGGPQYEWYFKQKLCMTAHAFDSTLEQLTAAVNTWNAETVDRLNVHIHNQYAEPMSLIWLVYSFRAPTRKAAYVLSYALGVSLELDISLCAEVEIVRATPVVNNG